MTDAEYIAKYAPNAATILSYEQLTFARWDATLLKYCNRCGGPIAWPDFAEIAADCYHRIWQDND